MPVTSKVPGSALGSLDPLPRSVVPSRLKVGASHSHFTDEETKACLYQSFNDRAGLQRRVV